ncbi:hypothetical protein NDU88_002241 [Pleurodeles waltl]|uniref:Uncharacterized protein n=1 Tax=Pleurodeles waltl TaxID=8319 RepID=A0AAV7MMS5_PLEWA|nr:hypothetical protein NDU88_002241 [Pleurodeles waltl]
MIWEPPVICLIPLMDKARLQNTAAVAKTVLLPQQYPLSDMEQQSLNHVDSSKVGDCRPDRCLLGGDFNDVIAEEQDRTRTSGVAVQTTLLARFTSTLGT